MQNLLKSWDNMYTITCKIDSYFPFQWEVCPLVGYMKDPSNLWNEKVTIFASDEICWSVNTLHLQKFIHNKDIQIIIENTKSIKELRQYVHNNLQRSFKFPISVGSVTVSSLYDKPSQNLK